MCVLWSDTYFLGERGCTANYLFETGQVELTDDGMFGEEYHDGWNDWEDSYFVGLYGAEEK